MFPTTITPDNMRFIHFIVKLLLITSVQCAYYDKTIELPNFTFGTLTNLKSFEIMTDV